MDQDILKRTYQELNTCHCVYEKSILANYCRCSKAELFYIAERAGVQCQMDSAQAQCLKVFNIVCQQSRFILKNTDPQLGNLSHLKTFKLQVGGLQGLYRLIYPDSTPDEIIHDVYDLLTKVIARYPDLNLPFQTIIRYVAAFKVRTRRKLKNL